MPSSYNGWTASKDKKAIGIVPFEVRGRSFPGGVKGGDVEAVLRYLVEQFHERVERLDAPGPADEWGYYYRQNRNSNNLSCHASGTAIDLNATRHPNKKSGTFTAKQVAAIREILAEVDHVVRWGGDFRHTKDEMHFEINADAAAVKRVATKLRRAAVPSQRGSGQPAAARKKPADPRLHQGCQGHSVMNVQNALIRHGYKPDPAECEKAVWGPGTDRAFRRFQADHGRNPDGIAWAAEWALLRKAPKQAPAVAPA